MVFGALFLEHALVVRAVNALYVDLISHELFARSVEVLGSEADACVARINLNPLKVMSKESFFAEVRSGEISLPTPAHLVDCK